MPRLIFRIGDLQALRVFGQHYAYNCSPSFSLSTSSSLRGGPVICIPPISAAAISSWRNPLPDQVNLAASLICPLSAASKLGRYEIGAKVIAVMNHPNIRQLLRCGPELSGDGVCRGTAGDGPLTLKSDEIVTERSGHESE